jgi:hypothetical protein
MRVGFVLGATLEALYYAYNRLVVNSSVCSGAIAFFASPRMRTHLLEFEITHFVDDSYIAKGRRHRAEGKRFITGTWLFQPLKKVLTFMATAIS